MVKARFFNKYAADPLRSVTVERTFNTCTWGLLRTPEPLSVVLPTEEIPCSGA